MKIKLLGVAILSTAMLVGCQGGNGDNGTEPDNNDTNVEQTRFNAGTQNGQDNRQDFDMNQNNNENGGGEYDLSEEAAQRITDEVEGIESANVVTTENNAYVAAEIDATADTQKTNNGTNNGNNGNNGNDGNALTDNVKKQISDIVKSVENDIDNVYVSTNPDFGDLVSRYADQAENGDPIEGIFDQMGNMIERVFPQNENN